MNAENFKKLVELAEIFLENEGDGQAAKTEWLDAFIHARNNVIIKKHLAGNSDTEISKAIGISLSLCAEITTKYWALKMAQNNNVILP